MDTAAAALLPALLATAGLPPGPGCELVRQVFPFSGVWRLRFPQCGGATVIYKHALAPLDREHVALAYAASCGIPVPQVIAARQQDGRAGILMTDLGQPARPATGADAARLAAQVHRAPGNGLPVTGAAALAAMPERIAALAASHGLSEVTARTAAVIARSAPRLAAPAIVQPIGLCHSEWHPDSILIDAGGHPHVYDWARAFTGPGLLDLASWHGTRAAPDLTATRALIEAYVEAGGHRAALASRAGLPAEAWALGWHRLWAADWYLQQLDMGWIPGRYLLVQRQAIERHVAEAAALLRPEVTAVRARLEWTRQPGTGPPPAILGNLTGRAVVELGCGSGHNLAVLAARHGATATGIDRDPAKVARARDLYGHVPGLQVIHADAASYLTTLPVASLDACLSIFGAFSFSPPGPLLKAAARALRPGGLLAVTLRASDHHDAVVILTRR